MARSISITTPGLTKILSKLNSFPRDLQIEINAEMGVAALELARMAKSNAPADEGSLRMAINTKKENNSWEVAVQKAHAPYMEFGTKRRFRPTRGFERYAAQFKGNRGASSGSLDGAILGWVKRNKIRFEKAGQQSVIGAKKKSRVPALKTRFLTPEQTAFIIARFISFHGVKPHPFLFPAFIQVRRNMTERMVHAIRRAFK